MEALKTLRSLQKTPFKRSGHWTIEQMGPEAAARVMGWLQENRIDRVENERNLPLLGQNAPEADELAPPHCCPRDLIRRMDVRLPSTFIGAFVFSASNLASDKFTQRLCSTSRRYAMPLWLKSRHMQCKRQCPPRAKSGQQLRPSRIKIR